MRIIEGFQAAKTALSRQSPGQSYPVSPKLKASLKRLFGTGEPEEAVRQIIGEVRERGDAALRDLFVDRTACDTWLATWRARLAQTPWDDAERQAAMLAANPTQIVETAGRISCMVS